VLPEDSSQETRFSRHCLVATPKFPNTPKGQPETRDQRVIHPQQATKNSAFAATQRFQRPQLDNICDQLDAQNISEIDIAPQRKCVIESGSISECCPDNP
jgi:hypothetical protein